MSEQAAWLKRRLDRRASRIRHAHELLDQIEREGLAATIEIDATRQINGVSVYAWGEVGNQTIEIPDGPKAAE